MESTNIAFNHFLLGEVSIRRFTVADFKNVIDLFRLTDDYLFCCHVIKQQIVKPKVSLVEIQKWNRQTLIEVAREFARRETTISPYFHNTNDQNFFADFKHACQSYDKERTTRITRMLIPPEVIKNLTEFSNRISTAIEAYYKPINLATESLKKHFIDIQSAVDSISLPIKRAMIEFNERYGKTFAKFAKTWVEFAKTYKISKEEAVQILKRYKWCISGSFPTTFIFSVVSVGKEPGNHRKEINQLFIEYFSRNNFRNLKMMVESWKNNPLFSPRMKIIRDALAIFMHSVNTRRNYCTVVLPPLLAQIDGIFSQILEKNGIDIKKLRGYREKKNKFSQIDRKIIDEELQNLIEDIFLNILFERAEYGDMTTYSFNRHKILHGEYLRYGRKDNVLRAFLILDFLYHF